MALIQTRRPEPAIREIERLANGSNGGAGWLARGAAVLGLGAAGWLLGGFPIWAARRILYPMGAEPLPQNLDEGLDLGVEAHPERVEFESLDGHPLSGWFVQAPDAAPGTKSPCVLLVYGYGGYKEQMVGYARILHAGGFATFMFDMQGSGLRRGEPLSLGYNERWDLIAAAHYLETRSDVDADRIGVFGVSMGGATALLAAAEEPSIRAVVSDSSYADLLGMVRPGVEAFIGKPAVFFAPLIVRYCEMMANVKTSDVVPEEAASRLGDRPLFVIHGESDQLVPVESAYRIYEHASGPRELWIIPDCLHAEGPNVAADEWKARVNGFFDRWLRDAPTPQP